jgi:4-hydroxy-3-methylbut-2-en-1-yl diphosphate reductase
MQLLLAEEMGMCFGVRDALKTLELIEQPEKVSIHGELVHNPIVLQQLDRRGFHRVGESDRESRDQREFVLITAHGISNRERQRLSAGGKQLIDTTCPLVRRVHEKAMELQRQGYFVVLFGKHDHVEVRGIVEDLDRYRVFEREEEMETLPESRIALICQTTLAPDRLKRLRDAFGAKNPRAEIRFVDTSCHPTRARQEAVAALLERVDLMIVVGGSNSNNTRELTRKCEARGVRAFQVQHASELRMEWFDGVKRVGLTAGTSTLASTIDEVRAWIEGRAANVG